MITLLSSPGDRALADRLVADLRAAGYTVTERVQSGREPVVVAILSPESLGDPALLRAVEAANDAGQNVVLVASSPVEVPEQFDHLTPLDFSQGYAFDTLRAQVDELTGEHAPYALRMHTQKVRASNRRAALALAALVGAMFVIALIMIILFDIESPAEEYAAVDTAAAMTRDMMIGPTMAYLGTALPRSSEQAQAFPETLEAVGTIVRPFVAATATTMSEQLAQFEGVPAVTATPESE